MTVLTYPDKTGIITPTTTSHKSVTMHAHLFTLDVMM